MIKIGEVSQKMTRYIDDEEYTIGTITESDGKFFSATIDVHIYSKKRLESVKEYIQLIEGMDFPDTDDDGYVG